MKKQSDLVRDMHDILTELTSPSFPEGIREMDIARYFAGGMGAEEKARFEAVITRDKAFAVEIERRRQLHEEFFSEEMLDDYERSIFAAVGIPPEEQTEPPVPVIEWWREALAGIAEKIRAETRQVLEYVVPIAFLPAMGGGGMAGHQEVGADVGKRFAIRFTPQRDEKHVRVLVEFGDVALDGRGIRLVWSPDGKSQPAVLKRPNERANFVKGEFLLTKDHAYAAMKEGLVVEPCEL